MTLTEATNLINHASAALEQWDSDEASNDEIAAVFGAIFNRPPNKNDDPVSDIYAARDALDAAEAARLLRVI